MSSMGVPVAASSRTSGSRLVSQLFGDVQGVFQAEQGPDHGVGSRAAVVVAAVVVVVVVGSRASTVNQPPGSGPAARCPPEASTRPRSPARPCPGGCNGSGGGAPSLRIRRVA